MTRCKDHEAGRVALVVLGCSCLLLAACGDDVDPPRMGDGSVAVDGAVAGRGDAGAPQHDGAIPPDTKPAVKTVPTSTKGDRDKHSTCAAVCQSKGATCSGACDTIGAGRAKYGYLNKYGWYTVVKTIDLADCQHSPPQSTSHQGKSYSLASWYCCCDLPEPHKITKVSGDMSNIRSCNEVCKARGKSCDSKHDWGSAIPGQPNIGGVKAWYQRVETGGSMYVHAGCTLVPPSTKKLGGFIRQLMGYTCACY